MLCLTAHERTELGGMGLAPTDWNWTGRVVLNVPGLSFCGVTWRIECTEYCQQIFLGWREGASQGQNSKIGPKMDNFSIFFWRGGGNWEGEEPATGNNLYAPPSYRHWIYVFPPANLDDLRNQITPEVHIIRQDRHQMIRHTVLQIMQAGMW